MHRLGQHFLTNESVLRKIAEEVFKTPVSTIIEIGPGHGELTEVLRDAGGGRRGTNPKIIAVEKDPNFVVQLSEKFKDEKSVEIIEGDIRTILPQFTIHDSRFTLCGNIPYYLTGYLFRLIGDLEPKPETCVFMIQREVAARLTARRGAMNRLAAAVQYWAEAKILFQVGREDFSPPPKVDSTVIRLTPKRAPSKEYSAPYYSLIRRLFAAPRKTILNNLAGKMSAPKRLTLEKDIRRCGIDPAMRPQNLEIEAIEMLAGKLSETLLDS